MARPSRFRIEARLHATGDVVAAHCADPGRLLELLIPSVTVYVSRADNPAHLRRLRPALCDAPGERATGEPGFTRTQSLVWEELQADRLAPFAGAQEIARGEAAPLDHDGVRSRFDFRLSERPAHPVGSK
ncbi:MAG: hypothetical protein R3A10_14325 [Caldilineaceae bacterium]